MKREEWLKKNRKSRYMVYIQEGSHDKRILFSDLLQREQFFFTHGDSRGDIMARVFPDEDSLREAMELHMIQPPSEYPDYIWDICIDGVLMKLTKVTMDLESL